jgi:hypothetical protein
MPHTIEQTAPQFMGRTESQPLSAPYPDNLRADNAEDRHIDDGVNDDSSEQASSTETERPESETENEGPDKTENTTWQPVRVREAE